MMPRRLLPWVVPMLGGLLALGLFSFARQLMDGDAVTGMRSIGAGGAVWGLYLVMDGYLLGAGVAIMAAACVARFSRDRDMEAVARIAMPVAITCFLGAALSVLADQGRPWFAIRDLALYARPSSPLFTTFATVGSVCLYGSLVHCVLARRPDLAEYAKRPSLWQGPQRILASGYTGTPGQRYRRQQASFWMSSFMLPALCAPLIALAAIFIVRPGRAPVVVALEMVSFLLLAAMSGLGLLLVAAAVVRRLAGPNAGLHPHAIGRLGRVLLLLIALSLLAIVVSAIVAIRSSEPATASYATALLRAPYGPSFWGTIAILLVTAVFLWRALHRRTLGPRGVVAASVLVQIAVFGQRYLSLVAWQTHGLSLPYRPGTYCPTWPEVGVQLGILAVCGLLFLPSVRLIPFAPLTFEDVAAPKPARDLRRTVFTALWLLLGLGLAGVGLLFSGRAFTEAAQDPVLPASPILFVTGLALLASTGAVYELLPERRPR